MAILSLDCQKKLDFLSGKQKAELNRHFSNPGTNVMPHQLAIRLGITHPEALTIITILEAHRLSENKLLIYHVCEPEVPVGTMPYGKGFPHLPWRCPNCEEIVESYDELGFDIMAIAHDQIKFI